MKKAIIIHGWESGPEEHWYQEEGKILENLGFEVHVPKMPGESFVIEAEWIEVLMDLKPGAADILIGHSLGAPTILRYLEKATSPVGKVFLIAGFVSPLSLDYPNAEYPKHFVDRPFDWVTIKKNAKNFVVLNQNNDPWVNIEKGEELAERLGVLLTRVEGNNHFDTMDLELISEQL